MTAIVITYKGIGGAIRPARKILVGPSAPPMIATELSRETDKRMVLSQSEYRLAAASRTLASTSMINTGSFFRNCSGAAADRISLAAAFGESIRETASSSVM